MAISDRFKIAFSTLGCPAWDIKSIIKSADNLGFDGVEFRGYQGELDIFKLPEFSERAIETAKSFKNAQLEISCFSSSVRISFEQSANEKQKNIDEIKAYGELCNIFESPYIRIFAGFFGEIDKNEAVNIATSEIAHFVKIAKEYNVTLLLETHDDWLDCFLIKTLMEQVNSQHIGVLWDTHHPYRLIGEEPVQTWHILGDWIKYTHWKDSCTDKSVQEGFRPCPTGKGDIPLKEIYSVLNNSNYKGYFTFE